MCTMADERVAHGAVAEQGALLDSLWLFSLGRLSSAPRFHLHPCPQQRPQTNPHITPPVQAVPLGHDF